MAFDAEGRPDHPDKPVPDTSGNDAPSLDGTDRLSPDTAHANDKAFRADHIAITSDGPDDTDVVDDNGELERIEASSPAPTVAARTALSNAMLERADPELADDIELTPGNEGGAESDEADTDTRSVDAEVLQTYGTTTSEASETPVRVYPLTNVALFTVHNDRLAVVLERQEKEGDFSLPGRMFGPGELLGKATQIVDEMVAESATKSPLEPRIWQLSVSGIERDSNNDTWLRVGHATVAGILTFPSDRFVAVDAHNLLESDDNTPLLVSEAAIVHAALDSLYAAIGLAPDGSPTAPRDTWPIVGRLLSDPNNLIMSELQAVFEAIAGKEIQKDNFRRYIKGIVPAIVKTNAQRIGQRGRPPTIYRIPPSSI